MGRTKNTKLIILLLLIVAATFLRVYKLNQVPVSLFSDEVDIGYHAYSILKTGKDYVGNPWPLHFQSLAEHRTPLYLYSAVPSVALFGITPLGVRLPAAIFGVLSIIAFYFLLKIVTKDMKSRDSDAISLLGVAVLTFSPWHIQYSRAAFEVTELLFFLLLGFYFFFLSIEKKENNKYLWLSAAMFGISPWVYSTAKFYIPLISLALFLIYFKEIMSMKFRHIRSAIFTIVIFALPMIYSIFSQGAAQRFGYISVFSDPVIETEVKAARDRDYVFSQNDNTFEAVSRRVFHNRYTFITDKIVKNILKSYSTDFLFIKGDLNLRHSIAGIGQLYRIEFIPLMLGLVYFFSKFKDKKVKIFILSWMFLGTIPAAITRDGGDHATRLFVLAPLYSLVIAFGIYSLSKVFSRYSLLSKAVLFGYGVAFIISFAWYQHIYWVDNPWYSERWWHAGFSEAIQKVITYEDQVDKIIISNSTEPPWIFFAVYSDQEPSVWQANYPVDKYTDIGPPFNRVTYFDKYYFGQPEKIDFEELGEYLLRDTIYLASAKEIKINLARNPQEVPVGLELLDSITFPSGEPAFYIFRGLNDKIETQIIETSI